MLKRFGIIAGLLLLAFLLLPRGDGDKSGQPNERNVTPAQEVSMKEALVTDDVTATDELCRNQCALDLKTVSGQIGLQAGDSEVKRVLQSLQKDHPHMKKLIYARAGAENGPPAGRIEVGEVPHDADYASADQIDKALREASNRGMYQSPPLATANGTYFVMGVSTDDGKGTLVSVVHQQILDQVRDHQMKNLRVVPYPAEKNWKIESVKTDTLEDVTVQHPEQNEGTSHYHKNQVVVKFRNPPSEADLTKIQQELGAGPAKKLGYTYVFESTGMEAQQMMQYFQKWNVDYAEPHYLYLTNDRTETQDNTNSGDSTATSTPNDILYSRYQWNLPIIETLKGWGIGKGSEDVKVAVVDTGVDLTHPDLSSRLLPGMNVVTQGQSEPQDDVGHGTHVAGVISALVNNGEGVAGMTWNNPILPVKVLDASGSGSTYAVAQGIIWAADNGAKVINMSLGNYADAQFLHDAIKYAYDKDVVLIAASGNDNTERPGFPAAYPEVFAVAATDSKNNKASFSNYGDYIDVAAPGVGIPSTYPHNQYAALSGTSMASPHVSALAALIRSVNPLLKNTEVMDIMRQSATDIGDPGKDIYFGYGLIDVVKALQMANESRQSLSYFPEWLQREFDRIAKKFQG